MADPSAVPGIRFRPSSSRRGQAPRPSIAWIARTQPPQSVPALQAEAICLGVQAPASACSLTCFSVMPKHEQTYTRFTSWRDRSFTATPFIGEANLTLPGAQRR